MDIFSLGLLAPTLTYFMKTVGVLSRHCLLLSWLKHYWAKGLFTDSGSSRYQSRCTGEVPALVHFTSPTATELLLLQDCFLLHPKKAVVCYPDLVRLLLGDYKTAPHCYFPLFWLNFQSSKKMNPTKITSQITLQLVRRFGNPDQGGPEWWIRIPDMCLFLAVLPLYEPSAALNADMIHLQWLCPADENRKGPMGAFQFLICCRILWQLFWGWYCPTSKGQHPPSCPLSQHITHSNFTQTMAPNHRATSPCSEES